ARPGCAGAELRRRQAREELIGGAERDLIRPEMVPAAINGAQAERDSRVSLQLRADVARRSVRMVPHRGRVRLRELDVPEDEPEVAGVEDEADGRTRLADLRVDDGAADRIEQRRAVAGEHHGEHGHDRPAAGGRSTTTCEDFERTGNFAGGCQHHNLLTHSVKYVVASELPSGESGASDVRDGHRWPRISSTLRCNECGPRG